MHNYRLAFVRKRGNCRKTCVGRLLTNETDDEINITVCGARRSNVRTDGDAPELVHRAGPAGLHSRPGDAAGQARVAHSFRVARHRVGRRALRVAGAAAQREDRPTADRGRVRRTSAGRGDRPSDRAHAVLGRRRCRSHGGDVRPTARRDATARTSEDRQLVQARGRADRGRVRPASRRLRRQALARRADGPDPGREHRRRQGPRHADRIDRTFRVVSGPR